MDWPEKGKTFCLPLKWSSQKVYSPTTQGVRVLQPSQQLQMWLSCLHPHSDSQSKSCQTCSADYSAPLGSSLKFPIRSSPLDKISICPVVLKPKGQIDIDYFSRWKDSLLAPPDGETGSSTTCLVDRVPPASLPPESKARTLHCRLLWRPGAFCQVGRKGETERKTTHAEDPRHFWARLF